MATSSTAHPLPASGSLAPPRPERGRRLSRLELSRTALEGMAVFAVFFAVYVELGYRLVVERHVVVFDAFSRLAHAYFVWYNAPPKLAAIGFEWPPLQTLALVPFAAIKPLATSLFALSLTSGAFGAATVAVLNRALSLLEMRPWMRYPILVAFGLNPMFAWYAVNGMAEAVTLFFLTFGIHFFLRWYLEHETHYLALVGLGLSLALLSRYELFAYAAVVAVAILLVLLVRDVDRQQIEGALLLYLAPVVYVAFLWVFFNWLIIGDPLFFLKLQTAKNVVHGAGVFEGTVTPSQVLRDVLILNLKMFPLTVVAAVGLLVAFAHRRDVMSVSLAVLVSLNALFTTALIINSGNIGLLQLRYNMRGLPLAVLGVGWLFYVWRRSAVARTGVWAAALAVLAISIPVTWHTMDTYPYQFGDQAAIRAVETGRDQENTRVIGNYYVGISGERAMADYVLEHIHARNSIFTDDQQGFSVMLLSGHPELFVDRIDKGDGYWKRVLARPWRYPNVRYMLINKPRKCPNCQELVREYYPDALAGRASWLRRVYETSDFALFEIVGRPPRRPGARL